jgi:translation initiation factor 3 subunit L
MEGWSVYRELFEELLDEENVTASQPAFYLLPEWTFDILHEFVYQFQGFCQFRAAVFASAKKHNISTDSPGEGPHHLIENLTHLAQNKEAWVVETVVWYLTRLINVGKNSDKVGYQYLGIFASIALSRLECLLGDYTGCLKAVESVVAGKIRVLDGAESASSLEVMQSVLAARLSYAYHAGVSLLMSRRYKDAIRVLADTCFVLQRGLKTGQLRKLANFDQFSKQNDRMVALLAILTHICPPSGLVDESLLRLIREKHGSQLAKEDVLSAYQDLYVYASPKFISPGVTASGNEAYKLQVTRFMKQMESQPVCRKLRSYLKLYTSIETSKLAAFNDMEHSDFLALLLSYKHKMKQLEDDGEYRSAMDIHYHLNGALVHVDEAEKQRRFENYFLSQIAQNSDIMKDVESIVTKL